MQTRLTAKSSPSSGTRTKPCPLLARGQPRAPALRRATSMVTAAAAAASGPGAPGAAPPSLTVQDHLKHEHQNLHRHLNACNRHTESEGASAGLGAGPSGGSGPQPQVPSDAQPQPHPQPQPPHQLQPEPEPVPVLRVLDLFSGIGGMHHALLRVLPQGTRLEVTAADINMLANKMYAEEFGVQPRTLDLQRITAAQLDELAADLWLLTPPCQPYTTGPNARRRDTSDPRAAALLRLVSAEVGLPAMRRPPARLLLENVPGFVGSGSHGALRAALAAAGYEVQEFVVSPHQLGVPYSRPRYFALALQHPLRFANHYDCSRGPVEHPPTIPGRPASLIPPPRHSVTADLPLASATHDGSSSQATNTATIATAGELQSWPPVYDAGPRPPSAPLQPTPPSIRRRTLAPFLESVSPPMWPPSGHEEAPAQEGGVVADDGEPAAAAEAPMMKGSSPALEAARAVAEADDPWVTYGVPAAQLARFWRVLDVVTPSSTYCNCFTKHYADNVLGAGSVLASESFAASFCARDSRGRLHFAAPPPLASWAALGARRGSSGPADGGGAAAGIAAAGVAAAGVHGSGGGGCGAGAGDAAALAIAAAAAGEVVPVVFRQHRGGAGRIGRALLPGPGRRERGRGSGRRVVKPEEVLAAEVVEGEAEAAVAAEAVVEGVVYGLRFFTPSEVAAIHGLADGWAERARHAAVQPRQQYGLLGNGLSTDVAAHLLRYLLAEPMDECATCVGSSGDSGGA